MKYSNYNEYFSIGILCLYGLNVWIDVIITILLTLYLIKNIKNDNFEYMFFALLFFEPILTLPFVNCSFYRIYQLLFVYKIIIDIFHRKREFEYKNLVCIIFFIIAITGLIYLSFLSYISLIINTAIVVYISLVKKEEKNYYNKLLYFVGLSAFFAAIFGLFRGATFSYGDFYRRCITVEDPNYSALFLIIGLWSIVENNEFNKHERYIYSAFIILSLLLTVSLTGIFTLMITLLIYIFIKSKKQGIIVSAILFVSIGLFLLIPLKTNNFIYGIQTRITSIFDMSLSGATSGRSELFVQYIKEFFNQPLYNIIFGGKDILSGQLKQDMINKFQTVSHNSYIDMLYMTGIPATLLIISYGIFDIIRLWKMYKKGYNLAIKYLIIKIALLIIASTISIFPNRYFMIFYIICFSETDEILKNIDVTYKKVKDILLQKILELKKEAS